MTYLKTLIASLSTHAEELEAELLRQGGSDGLPHLWDARPYAPIDDLEALPSAELFSLLEKMRADARAIEALLTPSRYKLVQTGSLHLKVAALNTVVTLNVADAIEELGGLAALEDLAKHVNTNAHKLGRILRILTAEYIFQEVSANVFKNTRHSIALVGSEGARYFLTFITGIGMNSALGLSNDLSNPETKDSFSEKTAPFCFQVAKNGETFFEYMGNPDNSEMAKLSTEGVVNWLNRLTRAPLIHDYLWHELGEAQVIDVGCGVGDSGMDIMREHKGLSWTFQDLPHVIDGLQKSVPEDMKSRVADGSISFVAQDYFQPNISKGNVWYLRGVLHEYTDSQCHQILSHIAAAMRQTPGSKMVVNEALPSRPLVVPESSSPSHAASVLPSESIPPENQSRMADTANIMTMNTFILFGGKERSYEEYELIFREAGFRIARFFPFRSFTVMFECVLG